MSKPRYTQEMLEDAVQKSESYMGVLRYLGIKPAGGSHTHIKARVAACGIDTSHFTGKASNRGKSSPRRKAADEILILYPQGSSRVRVKQLRRAMSDCGVIEQCVYCGLGTEWNGLPIHMEIDHINGEWLDNRLENLQYLCPNCHYQKTVSTHGGVVQLVGDP